MDAKAENLGQSLWSAMRDQMEQTVLGVMESVEQAPDGQWIDASEERVRDLFGQLRQQTYQQALQMRIDDVESDFSPGQGISCGSSAS